jgi:predicted small lipoprotein YifL
VIGHGPPIQRKPPSIQRTQRIVFSAIVAISAVLSATACGKKGPPLAPLVKLPVPPADITAARRGDTVAVSFNVPAANTDGTRPANVQSTEVYAITAPATVPPLSDANLLKYGTRIGSVAVKAPRDPNLTADVDDESDEVDPAEGPGLDQGAAARVTEPLSREMLTPVAVPRDKNAPPLPDEPPDRPLVGPPAAVPLRTYAAFGTSTRGKKGPLSRRVTVPLVPPPPPPSDPVIRYDEKALTLTWREAGTAESAAPAPDVLPSRAIGAPRPAITYNVYDATNPDAPTRLTATPLDVAKYSDARIVWGEKRCYTVVAAETVQGGTIESVPAPPVCETPVDTFPPAAPKELKAISSEGAINLIWEPSTATDVAGYIIQRGVEPAETLQRITPTPIVELSFTDAVQPGIAYVYVVRAVDKAGNISDPSPRATETAR